MIGIMGRGELLHVSARELHEAARGTYLGFEVGESRIECYLGNQGGAFLILPTRGRGST